MIRGLGVGFRCGVEIGNIPIGELESRAIKAFMWPSAASGEESRALPEKTRKEQQTRTERSAPP